MRVFLAQKPIEQIQAVGPEALVEAQPVMRARKRAGLEATQMRAAAHFPADQSRVLQRLDVLRCCRERDRKWFGKLTDRSLAKRKVAKHLPPRGIAKRVEDGIELCGV